MAARTSLRSSRDFQRVYRSGRRAREDGVTVWSAPFDGDAPRLGLAVRSSVGGAVKRNRVRRRLRAIFRAHVTEGGVDVVIAADATAAGLKYQELETHVVRALARAGAGS